MDVRFSSAIHALIMISESETPVSSKQIAFSVGTNPTYIRKLTSLLKKAALIESSQGKTGFTLKKKPEEISLYAIYRAVEEKDSISVFDLHQNSNDECIVGRFIQPVLSDVFSSLDRQLEQELKKETLASCIGSMKEKIEEQEAYESDLF